MTCLGLDGGTPRGVMVESCAVFLQPLLTHFTHFISLKKENTMIILRNPQIAELIEAGCAFNSNVIISKNETKENK